MEQKEFIISSFPKLKFRAGKISALEILALKTQIDFDDIEKTQETFKFILEHLEVNIGDKWIKVKEKDKDIYYPAELEDDVAGINDLIMHFLTEVIKPLFLKSNG